MKQTALVITILLAISVAFLTACTPATTDSRLVANVTRGPAELLGADILGSGAASTDVTILGVKLGMTDGQVLALLGPADSEQEYDFGAIRNWQYGPALDVNGTGVLFHFEKGFLTRISVFSAMNRYLSGNTSVTGRTEEMYARFGTPDRQYDIKGGRFFVYNTRGLEVYLKKENMDSFALVLPNRKLPSTATLDLNGTNSSAPTVPRLIIDTTTMCDEGPTQAFNPGSEECTRYTNACAIPAHWIEVMSCEPKDLTQEALRKALYG